MSLAALSRGHECDLAHSYPTGWTLNILLQIEEGEIRTGTQPEVNRNPLHTVSLSVLTESRRRLANSQGRPVSKSGRAETFPSQWVLQAPGTPRLLGQLSLLASQQFSMADTPGCGGPRDLFPWNQMWGEKEYSLHPSLICSLQSKLCKQPKESQKKWRPNKNT